MNLEKITQKKKTGKKEQHTQGVFQFYWFQITFSDWLWIITGVSQELECQKDLIRELQSR